MSRKILIVEDDDRMRDLLVQMLAELSAEQCDVWGAPSGEDALRLAGENTFDVVVTDVRMAGMDGLDTLAKLRELQPDVKSIVITGYASEDAPSRAIRLLASDYLYKPFRLGDLFRSVEAVLNAEREVETSNRVLDLFASSYLKFKQALTGAPPSSVEPSRERAFQTFYVGVRSRKLEMMQALQVWALLEEVEERRALLPASDQEQRQAVCDGYNYIVDLLSALSRPSVPLHATSKPGRVDTTTFAHLFERIRRGLVAAHQLAHAPFLRKLDAIVVSQSPELQKLRASLWGEPPD